MLWHPRHFLCPTVSGSPGPQNITTNIHTQLKRDTFIPACMCEEATQKPRPRDLSTSRNEGKVCSTGSPSMRGIFPITLCSWELSRRPPSATRKLKSQWVRLNDTLRMKNTRSEEIDIWVQLRDRVQKLHLGGRVVYTLCDSRNVSSGRATPIKKNVTIFSETDCSFQ